MIFVCSYIASEKVTTSQFLERQGKHTCAHEKHDRNERNVRLGQFFRLVDVVARARTIRHQTSHVLFNVTRRVHQQTCVVLFAHFAVFGDTIDWVFLEILFLRNQNNK